MTFHTPTWTQLTLISPLLFYKIIRKALQSHLVLLVTPKVVFFLFSFHFFCKIHNWHLPLRDPTCKIKIYNLYSCQALIGFFLSNTYGLNNDFSHSFPQPSYFFTVKSDPNCDLSCSKDLVESSWIFCYGIREIFSQFILSYQRNPIQSMCQRFGCC